MSAQLLSDAAVKGMILKGIATIKTDWIDQICLIEKSDRPTEDYIMLGAIPAMAEYIGVRRLKELRSAKISLVNKDYDASLKIVKDQLRRDKTGYLALRLTEFARTGLRHKRKLLSDLINNATAGSSGTAWDGQYFFDTDHSYADSGTIDNDKALDISAQACQVHGNTAHPSAEECAHVVGHAIETLVGMKDDQGEEYPNEDLTSVLIVCRHTLAPHFAQVADQVDLAQGVKNWIKRLGVNVTVVGNPRLTATDSINVFRNDGGRPSFILQTQDVEEFQLIGLQSEHCKINKEVLAIIDKSCAMGYGDFRGACRVQMT